MHFSLTNPDPILPDARSLQVITLMVFCSTTDKPAFLVLGNATCLVKAQSTVD
jgi:hypothetical protein